MANSAAKKLARANAARLRVLQLAILFTNLMYGVARGVVLRSSFGRAHVVAWGALAVLYGCAYGLLHAAARPTVRDGRVVSAGDDLAAGGLLEYAHDLIYLAVVAQVGCIFSLYALLIFLAVPAFAIYSLVTARANAATPTEEIDPRQVELARMSRKERRKHEREARKMG